jgi:hypothetical protein
MSGSEILIFMTVISLLIIGAALVVDHKSS